MFEAFAPLMALVFIYLIFALMAKAAKKVTQAQKAASGKPAAPAEAPEAPAPEPAGPQVRELQPSVRVTGHDDTVYQGSLHAVTGEGYDPCHDEQLAHLTRSEAVEHVPVTMPGLQLNWTGDEIVRGIVISEILKRKGA